MVVFYDLETKKIKRTEDNTYIPKLPANLTIEEKEKFYKENGESFLIVGEELGIDIFNYKIVEENNEFKLIREERNV